MHAALNEFKGQAFSVTIQGTITKSILLSYKMIGGKCIKADT